MPAKLLRAGQYGSSARGKRSFSLYCFSIRLRVFSSRLWLSSKVCSVTLSGPRLIGGSPLLHCKFYDLNFEGNLAFRVRIRDVGKKVKSILDREQAVVDQSLRLVLFKVFSSFFPRGIYLCYPQINTTLCRGYDISAFRSGRDRHGRGYAEIRREEVSLPLWLQFRI